MLHETGQVPASQTPAGPREIVLGVTGASGSLLAVRFLEAALALEAVDRVHLVVSRHGQQVAQFELGADWSRKAGVRSSLEAVSDDQGEKLAFHRPDDFFAPIASGTYPFDAMVILPCSVGTLGTIAGGGGQNLLHRAADVALKERRRLILGLRETPLNQVHLKNCLTVDRAGGIIYPFIPSFYDKPADINAMVGQYVGHLLTLCGLPNRVAKAWRRDTP